MIKNKKAKFFVGKISKFSQKKGWFFGHFMDEKLLHSDLVEIAWQDISNKKPNPADKHFHKKSVEINIVISGRIKLRINDQSVTVNKGMFYIIYPYGVVSDVEADKNTELIVIRAPSITNDKFRNH